MTQFTTFSKNGIILPISDATVSLFNIEYSYGYGVYETLKVRNRVLYFVDQHIGRLEHSAKELEIAIPYSLREIKQFLTTFVNQLDTDACNIKMLLIGGEQTTLYIFASAPLFPDRKLYKDGAKLISYTYERLFPTAKTLNMLPSYLAYKKAKTVGAYDALLIDKKGIILEGTRTNVYLVKNNTIYRAPEHRVLEGVTFLTLARVAEKYHIPIMEKEIYLSDLPSYEGMFITSTSTKIMPVRNINTFSFSIISPFILQLIKQYETFLEECNGNL